MSDILAFSAGLAQTEARQYLGMYRAVFGTAPEANMYASTAGALNAYGGSTGYIGMVAPTLNGMSGASLASTVLVNCGITPGSLGGATPAASYAALESALSIFFSAFPQDRGQVIYNLVRILPNLQSDAVYGSAAASFNANVGADFVRLDAVPDPGYVYPGY